MGNSTYDPIEMVVLAALKSFNMFGCEETKQWFHAGYFQFKITIFLWSQN